MRNKIVRNVTKKIVVLILLLTPFPVFSNEDVFDRYILSEMKRYGIPGLSIAILKKGKIIKTKGYGFSNVELMTLATPETLYQSASIGKQFTATLIMMLQKNGQLKLDDKVSQYIPNTPSSWKNITIRNLLSHTSGIKDYELANLNYRLDYTDEQLVKKIELLPLDFEPSSQWKYSNSGYFLLGTIIKKVTGIFYGDLLQKYIFIPLEMRTARIISEEDIILNRASGYRYVNEQLKNQEYVSPSFNQTADGGLYFSVLDLAKWDKTLYTEKLLKKSYLEAMWTPTKLNNGATYDYGFGWEIDKVEGTRVIKHSGHWQGFSGIIARFIDNKFTVIVLTNSAGKDPDEISKLAYSIASRYRFGH